MSKAKRWSRVTSQILVWAGEEPLVIGYDGDEIKLPARTEIAQKGAQSPYRFESAQSKAGHFIPGTVLLTDLFRNTDSGGYEKIFDVNKLCEYLDRDRQDLFARGFAIVSDPEDVTPLMREQLIPAWESSQDERARQVIATELERRKRLEAKGNPITPGSSEHHVLWAFKHMAKRQAANQPMLTTEDLFAVASGSYTPKDTPPPALAETKPAGAIGRDPIVLYAEAKALGVRLNKAELDGLLAGDVETVVSVTEQVHARRVALEQVAST